MRSRRRGLLSLENDQEVRGNETGQLSLVQPEQEVVRAAVVRPIPAPSVREREEELEAIAEVQESQDVTDAAIDDGVEALVTLEALRANMQSALKAGGMSKMTAHITRFALECEGERLGLDEVEGLPETAAFTLPENQEVATGLAIEAVDRLIERVWDGLGEYFQRVEENAEDLHETATETIPRMQDQLAKIKAVIEAFADQASEVKNEEYDERLAQILYYSRGIPAGLAALVRAGAEIKEVTDTNHTAIKKILAELGAKVEAGEVIAWDAQVFPENRAEKVEGELAKVYFGERKLAYISRTPELPGNKTIVLGVFDDEGVEFEVADYDVTLDEEKIAHSPTVENFTASLPTLHEMVDQIEQGLLELLRMREIFSTGTELHAQLLNALEEHGKAAEEHTQLAHYLRSFARFTNAPANIFLPYALAQYEHYIYYLGDAMHRHSVEKREPALEGNK